MVDLGVIRRWVGDSERWLSSFLEALPSTPSVVVVAVMGSAVRERGHRRSDFDLLILYRGTRPSIEAPLEVDSRLYAAETVQEKLASGHEIVGWAMKFGIPIYDPEGIWRGLWDSWHDRVPLPSAIEARDRGNQSLARAREMLEAGDDSAADDLLLGALTQFVRQRLINHGVFPASRPELPRQLRAITPNDPLSQVLEDAMYGDFEPSELLLKLSVLIGAKAA